MAEGTPSKNDSPLRMQRDSKRGVVFTSSQGYFYRFNRDVGLCAQLCGVFSTGSTGARRSIRVHGNYSMLASRGNALCWYANGGKIVGHSDRFPASANILAPNACPSDLG